MKRTIALLLSVLLGSWGLTTTVLAQAKSDHSTFDMEPTVPPGGDVSCQCGALGGTASKPKRTAFTMHITMSNRSDIGGSNGFVRVSYRDGDTVDYAIPVDTTLNLTLAGGGTPGSDDIITVTGTGGAKLVGQVSLSTDKGKPHPDLPLHGVPQGTTNQNYCTVTHAP
jgi:hypothetical protein